MGKYPIFIVNQLSHGPILTLGVNISFFLSFFLSFSQSFSPNGCECEGMNGFQKMGSITVGFVHDECKINE